MPCIARDYRRQRTAYGSWRDGGLTLLDVQDRSPAEANQPPVTGARRLAAWYPPRCRLPDRDLLVVLQ